MKSIRYYFVMFICIVSTVYAQYEPTVPPELRGQLDAERQGFHDAANIRTEFWNFGMVGNYPADPIHADLSVFHSVEVPKGSGLNYSDGITPFVLAKVHQRNGIDGYIMETGFRERQGTSPHYNRIMRFEPRPGYFQPDPSINRGRSPAISSDARTWPDTWPDKTLDSADPGWNGHWDGYFGKRPAADQESYFVYDDQFYDAWDFNPDSRDSTRRGLGLRVEARGFQWANPQAGNVIFWHYDIVNEGTTDYDDNIIFGLYMDAGVGGSAVSCDGIAESDDDNAYFNRGTGLNLVYTWDKRGHGVGLSDPCMTTGYLGYAYLETPGNQFDLLDNDNDGITDEDRDSTVGQLIEGQSAIRAYVESHYNMQKFEAFYGSLETRPAYKLDTWWTGDENMNWMIDLNDVGEDGVKDTHDKGEGDGRPTQGEPNFGKTDLNESDQIGLSGFKMNRIRGADQTQIDNIVFYTEGNKWPQRLYEQFSNPIPAKRFDSALVTNYNIGFLFASGPFKLKAGKRERFSLALAYGADLTELESTVRVVQQIYNANYQFAVPPPLPTAKAEAGDGYVRLSWDNDAERGLDPVTNINDFEGYRIYRSTDPEFQDTKVIFTGRGTGPIGNGKPIAQFDLIDGKKGFSNITVEGIAYYYGNESGITHSWIDTTVTNGQQYYYAVTAYDFGSDSLQFYPSENAISVSRTPRGGVILPLNVVSVRPNPKVAGYISATTNGINHLSGSGVGTINLPVINSALVPEDHLFKLSFYASPDSVHAEYYNCTDSTTGKLLFKDETDMQGKGTGQIAAGILPVVTTLDTVQVDTVLSQFRAGVATNVRFSVKYQSAVLPVNLRRTGYPDNITVTFSNTYLDTCLRGVGQYLKAKPVKFKVTAHTDTGDVRLRFFLVDFNSDSTLSTTAEYIDIVTYLKGQPTKPKETWRLQFDTTGQSERGPIIVPGLNDTFDIVLQKPYSDGDIFTFTSKAEQTNKDKLQSDFATKPYVVPNPYVGAASFEPERFAVSGRGERRMEFRALPQRSTIRIYTIHGELVQTLHQDGSVNGYVPWDLRTKDNLDVAPGLYIFQVEAEGVDNYISKFAIIK